MTAATDASARLDAASPWPRVLALSVLIAAAALRAAVPIDANIDWLVTNARQFLDGAALYRDIVETNPPMAILAHVPAALIARLTGWDGGLVHGWLVFLAALPSAAILARMAARLEPRHGETLAVILLALLILPLNAFGEREHMALILTLPVLAAAMGRAAGRPPTTSAILVAGLAAGLAAAFKPQMIPGIALPYLALALKQRRPHALLALEALVAAIICLLHWLVTVRAFPHYVDDVVPLLFDLYRPMRMSALAMLGSAKLQLALMALVLLAFARRTRLADPVSLILVAACLGFLIGFVDQGRDWRYHFYPAFALLVIASLRLVRASLADPLPQRIAAFGALGLCIVLSWTALQNGFSYRWPVIVEAIRARVAAPRILSISADLTPGHPITPQVGGHWGGTYASRWITVNARSLDEAEAVGGHPDPARRARRDQWQAHDRAVTNRDLATRRPDIVLIGRGPLDWPGWIAADAETARLMASYQFLAADALPGEESHFEGIEAWIRRDLVAP